MKEVRWASYSTVKPLSGLTLPLGGCSVDAYVIFGVWRRFVAGKMFRYVEMKDKVHVSVVA